MAKVKSFGERIADALVEDGLLSAGQVEELLEQQKKEGARLVKLIVDKAYVSEQDLAVCMGRVLNVPPVNLARLSIPEEIADLLPRETEYNHKVVPVARLENKLFLAMADPLNVLALDDVKRITKLEIAPLIASEKAIADKLAAIDTAKGGGSMEDIIQDAAKQEAEGDTVEAVKEAIEEVNLDKLAASSEEAPVIKLANLIIVQAIKDRASDIHLEPFEKIMRLRYRAGRRAHGRDAAAQADATGARLALQNHEQPRHRRTPPAAGRAHAGQGQRQGLRSARFRAAHRAWRKNRAPRARQIQSVRQHRQTRPGSRHLQAVQEPPLTRRTD